MSSPIRAAASDPGAKAAAQSGWTGDACVVDLRLPLEFAGSHPRGAISLPHSEKGLAKRLEAVLPPTANVVLVSDSAVEASARAQLEDAGWAVLGSLPSPETWTAAGLAGDRLEIGATAELADLIDGGVTLFDVREPLEWATGHLPGAVLISLGDLLGNIEAFDRTAAVAVVCEGGIRSSTAASLFKRAGFERVINLLDGTAAYRRSGRPLAFPHTP